MRQAAWRGPRAIWSRIMICAERAARPELRLVEGIDHRQAVGEHVREAHRDEIGPSPRLGDGTVRPAQAIFDRACVSHVASPRSWWRKSSTLMSAMPPFGVARIEIGSRNSEYCSAVGGARWHPGADTRSVVRVARMRRNALARLELVDTDPDRNAGAAHLAGRPVRDGLRATEAGLRQRVVDRRGTTPDQMREHLPLEPVRQVGAGGRGREIELRCIARLSRQTVISQPAGSRSATWS